MNARIDPLARQAVVGGRTYRLLLDCRAEAALVTVAGREYRVRLLQWREKAMLARLASLGQELVMRELVRMCADVTEELPPEAAAVLGEVAVWINDPSRAGAGVPFDSRSVATVMLQLCKATQLRPADFDGRSALEVEEMWQALGGGDAAPAREVASASGTRIVIVPDGEEAAESGGGETPSGQPAGTPAFPAVPVARWRLAHVRNRSTGEEPVEDRQSCLSGTRETGPNIAGLHTPDPARGMAGYKPALLSVSEERTGTRTAESLSREGTGMEGGLIARHLPGERAVPTSVGQQPELTTERAPALDMPAQATQDTERRRLGGWPGAVSAPRLAGGGDFAPPGSRSAYSKPHAVGALALQPIQLAPGAQSLRSPSSRVQPTDLPIDRQSLFDELADRLAEAAAEMGIGEV